MEKFADLLAFVGHWHAMGHEEVRDPDCVSFQTA